MLKKKDAMFEAYVLLFVLETLFLLWFSILPSLGMMNPPVLRIGDMEHFIVYFVYAIIATRIASYYTKSWKVLAIPFIVCSVVGGVCEFIQVFVPQRTGDYMDLVVDIAGSGIGSAVGFRFKTFFLK